MTSPPIYDFALPHISGNRVIDFKEFKGKVLLIVNVATKCGLTGSNYPQLSDLAEKFHDRGLRILCFPCNQFAAQEPGNSDDINNFACTFSPKFIMFQKIDVNGSNESPLYTYLKSSLRGFITKGIKWNFTKFLIDSNGTPVKRYGPNEEPKTIEPEIEKLLKDAGL